MSHFKAVSSCYGKIKHVLLIFPEYLLPQELKCMCPEEIDPIVEERVLDYYRPITTRLLEYQEGYEICFDFVVEHKVIIRGRRERAMLRGGPLGNFETLWFQRISINQGSPNDPPPILGIGLARPRCIGNLHFRLIYTNIDFDEIAREAMRAIDFESEHMKLGNIKELLQSVQDPFVPLNYGRDVAILEPFFSWPTAKGFPSPFNFKYIPEVISSQTNIMLKSFPFYIQGGNVLIGDDFVMMGGDIAKKNLEAFKNYSKEDQQVGDVPSTLEKEHVDKDDCKHGSDKSGCEDKQLDLVLFQALFAELMGLKKSYVVDGVQDKKKTPTAGMSFVAPEQVRDNPQELFHLDTFLTLVGKNDGGQEIALLGEIHRWNGKQWTENLSGETNYRLQFLKSFLERIENQLKSWGFHVVSLPLMYHNGQFYSYNNCLVEIFQKDPYGQLFKRAYLPKFQFENLDKIIKVKRGTRIPDFADADGRAMEVFRSLNFEPILVDMHFRTFAHSRVGLHCMVSVMARYAHAESPKD